MAGEHFIASKKTPVIERIFQRLWDSKRRRLRNTVVSMQVVRDTIDEMLLSGEIVDLSPLNVANFLKDILRSKHRNRHWPASPTKHRFTGRQITGTGDSFEFIPFAEGQDSAFPDHLPIDLNAPKMELQTLTLPPFAQEVDRWDESRLLQTVVALRVVETHFALTSATQVRQIAHVQNNVKLNKAELDALFIADVIEDGVQKKAAITCEVKYTDPLIASQIAKQVQAISALTRIEFTVVIPTAITAANGEIHLLELEPVPREIAGDFASPVIKCQSRFVLKPALPGFNAPKIPQPRKPRKKSARCKKSRRSS